MTRCYLLLCSAIVLRVFSGLATVMGCDALWTYPMFAWMSSVVPLTVYEVGRIKVLTAEKTKGKHHSVGNSHAQVVRVRL